MITRSLKLNFKLVYQLTQRTMICLSKCRPLNNASTETNPRILPSSLIAERFAPEPPRASRAASICRTATRTCATAGIAGLPMRASGNSEER
jgi:hypothetical protein